MRIALVPGEPAQPAVPITNPRRLLAHPTPTHALEAPMTDSPFDLPDHWSDTAKESAEEVLSARPDLSGADIAALEQAAELVTLADRLGEVAAAAGYVSRTDAGAETTHRAVTESRLARTSAAQIFSRLVGDSAVTSRSAAGRALARKRWAR